MNQQREIENAQRQAIRNHFDPARDWAAWGPCGQAVPTKGETRITIFIDDQIFAAFKAESVKRGIGYQTLINEALAQHIGAAEKPIPDEQVRKIVREELTHTR